MAVAWAKTQFSQKCDWTIGAAIGLSIFICLACWLFLRSDRMRIVDLWRSRSLSIARVTAIHAQQALQAVAETKETIFHDIEKSQTADEAAFRQEMSQERIFETLRDRIVGLSQISRIIIASTNGDIINSSSEYPPGVARIADKVTSEELLAKTRRSPYLTAPVSDLTSGKWTFSVAWPIVSKNGVFLGALIARIRCEFFSTFYEETRLSDLYDIVLAREDGIVVARAPTHGVPGESVLGAVFLTEVEAFTHGVWTEQAVSTSVWPHALPRVVAAARVNAFPLVAGVRIEVAKILADWYTKAVILAAGALTTSLFLTALLLWNRSTIIAEKEIHHREQEKLLLEVKLAGCLKADEEQIRLIDVITHQTFTPLSILKIEFNNISRSVAARRVINGSHFERIDRAIKKIETLINDAVLKTSRLSTPDRQLRPTNLHKACLNIIERLGDLFPNHPISLQFENMPPTDIIALDQGMLELALDNLVENSAKFSPAGTPIDVVCSWFENHVEISVGDRGQGLMDEDPSQLTRRYHRGKNADSVPGLGIGLRLVESVARAHNGKFVLKSRDGGGTLAVISLSICEGIPSE